MKIYKIIGVLTLFLSVTSCNEATTPPNNALNKGHEEAKKVTFTLTPGSLSDPNIGEYIEGKYMYADRFAPIEGKSSTVTITTKEDGKIESNGEIMLKPNTWYKLDINLYNQSGEKLNSQFISNEEQRNMHQFFLMPFTTDGSAAGRQINRDFIDYRYGDKYNNNELIMPPIGFVGYLKVLDAAPETFNINAFLVHIVPPSTKLSRSGKPYPYNRPEKLGTPITDINCNLTINVVK